MERRIKLKTLNKHITCEICKGYFIDATTVTECLHTFCKSCLVKHLEENNTCPTCQNVIHQSHPLQYISFDRTMQDIVYKLVPNLMEGSYVINPAGSPNVRFRLTASKRELWECTRTLHFDVTRRVTTTRVAMICHAYCDQKMCRAPLPTDEMRREREFYKSRNLPCPKDMPQQQQDSDDKANEQAHQEADYHRQDEQVNVCLDCISNNLRHLKRRFIRCSSQATITHLKKFLAKKVLNGIERYKDIDILCNDELLGKDHTLKFVYVTRWRFKDPPLRLQYRPRVDI